MKTKKVRTHELPFVVLKKVECQLANVRLWLRLMEHRVRSYTEDSYANDEAKRLAEQLQADISAALRGEEPPNCLSCHACIRLADERGEVMGCGGTGKQVVEIMFGMDDGEEETRRCPGCEDCEPPSCVVCGRFKSATLTPVEDHGVFRYCSMKCNDVYLKAHGDSAKARALLWQWPAMESERVLDHPLWHARCALDDAMATNSDELRLERMKTAHGLLDEFLRNLFKREENGR